MADEMRRAAIAARLNDRLRRTGGGGEICLSCGVTALPIEAQLEVFLAVQMFTDFSSENDPHGEHDCAFLSAAGQQIIWKIHYYDRGLSFRSRDPASSALTRRVLTIMLVEEC
ncbi:DUF3768 domain-containing protein [Sphingomonas sp. LR55]|uniref:DUF3768 domain-containing protein n=1 Tax=Sphingomonas sp. LR55 TaxID=3050231 RepID=UPI002FE2757E